MKKIIIKTTLLLLLANLCIAQNFVSNVSKRATTAAPFLNISQGARATAMGSAFVAVADDPTAVFWNPAGIARLNQNGVVVDHTEWIADLNYNFLSASINTGSFGALGISFITSDYGDMQVTTVDEPNGTGEIFNVSDAAFSVTWALNLTENFSIGFNPKVVYQSIWNMSGYAFAIDLGVLYNTPFEGITLGMAISNFGTKMSLDGNTSVILYDPDTGSTGNNSRIPAELQMDEWDLPLNFKVGLSYQPNLGINHDLIIALDAAHPNNDFESINVGGEYTFHNVFSIRAGYKSLFIDDAEESFTLGAGIVQRILGNIAIRFDYAYSDFGRLDNVQKFSVGINF